MKKFSSTILVHIVYRKVVVSFVATSKLESQASIQSVDIRITS